MSESYALYQYASCPFCARVVGFLGQTGIDLALGVTMKDTLRDPEAYRELVVGGGRSTVPCLRIASEDGAVRWLYESVDIMAYLDRRMRSD